VRRQIAFIRRSDVHFWSGRGNKSRMSWRGREYVAVCFCRMGRMWKSGSSGVARYIQPSRVRIDMRGVKKET